MDQRQTLRRSERCACFDRNHGDSSRHRMMLVFYLAKKVDEELNGAPEARRAKSLTPGFNSNRLLGKASDGNGQAWCKGKCGSGSEVRSKWSPLKTVRPAGRTHIQRLARSG